MVSPVPAAAACELATLWHAQHAEPPATPRASVVTLPIPPLALCSHINGLALALLLGVDGAILPPAVCRTTFNVTLDHLADDELWSPQPLGTLLDTGKMQAHWRKQHGIELQEVRGVVPVHAGMGEQGSQGVSLVLERHICTSACCARARPSAAGHTARAQTCVQRLIEPCCRLHTLRHAADATCC